MVLWDKMAHFFDDKGLLKNFIAAKADLHVDINNINHEEVYDINSNCRATLNL